MNRRNFLKLSTLAVSFSPTAPFAAEAEPVPILRFGLITDVQYADADPEGERHYRDSVGKLNAAVEWLSQQNLAFTLHLGDFIDRDFTSFATVLPLLQPLGHPVRHLLGNHDYSVADGDKAKVVRTLGMPSDYYSFSHSGLRFVMLDTNDVSVYKYPANSPKDLEARKVLGKLEETHLPNAKKWNGGLSAEQFAWLEKELTAADLAKERVILCGHHPLLPAGGMELWGSGDVLALIAKHPCVAAYFNGHDHAGAEVTENGVCYVTFKSILHEPGVNSFSTIQVFSNRIEILGKGREISRTLPLKAI